MIGFVWDRKKRGSFEKHPVTCFYGQKQHDDWKGETKKNKKVSEKKKSSTITIDLKNKNLNQL